MKISVIVRQQVTLIGQFEMEVTPDTAPDYYRATAVEQFQSGLLVMIATADKHDEYWDAKLAGAAEIEYVNDGGEQIDLNQTILNLTTGK